MKPRVQFSRIVIVGNLLAVLPLNVGCDEEKDPPPKLEDTPKVEEPTNEAPVAAAEDAKEPDAMPWADRVSPEGGFPCDVDEVLAHSCRRCHWEPQENDAPFPLVKHEDTQQMRSGKPIFKLMEQMVSADLMPPLDEPVEPKVTPLTPQQKETLLKWLASGAVKHEGKCP